MKELTITSKNIEDLNNLPSDLEILNCHYNKLEELPNLPDTLTELYCGCNFLKKLPELPDTLKSLYCFNNKLEELPELPDKLGILFCSENELTELPKLPDTLKILNCSINILSELPKLPKSLERLNCYNNPFECPISKDIIEKFDLGVNRLYTMKKEEEYRTSSYQYFLLDKYYSKFADIVYNFSELDIEFHDEVKDKYDHLFSGLKYNLI